MKPAYLPDKYLRPHSWRDLPLGEALREALQEVVKQDLSVADVAYPERARQFRTFLEQAGAELK